MLNEKVALYLRLSREDDEREVESQSITNQRDFLTDYVERHGWRIVDTYIDDGFTGTNFDRPDFQRMLQDIEAGKINVVITKDLSRLGRNYIETGHYIEIYFPTHRVRYIAVNDGIDTEVIDSQGNAMSPFTSVMNDFYARDISRKVRTALTVKKQKGQFIGTSAPYGYKKDPQDHGHLIIDEETAPIVRAMYEMYLNGTGLLGIANKLSKHEIPTPSQYKSSTFTQKRFEGLWNDVMVRRILTNPTYIGNLTQNRSSTISYKVSKRVKIKPEKWIVIEGTHEGIVSKEDFDAVQRLIKTRSYTTHSDGTVKHLLSGIVFCADCGAPMTFSRDGPRVYMRCSTAKRHGSLKLCTTHSIREDYVEKEVCDALREIAKSTDDNDLCKWVQNHKADNVYEKQKRKLEQQLAGSDQVLLSLYKDKVSGVVGEREYSKMQEQLRAEREATLSHLAEIEAKEQTRMNIQSKIALIKKVLEFETIDRNTLLLLVDRVLVHEKKKIDILFAFETPF